MFSINNRDGFINWRSDLSGDAGGVLLVENGKVFVSASFSSDNSSKSFFTVARSSGGVPLFRKDFSEVNAIHVKGSFVYLVSSSGTVRKLSIDGGKEVWKTDTKVRLQNDLAVSDQWLFVATNTNSVLKLDLETGEINSQFNTGQVVSKIVFVSGRLLIGSASGAISALDEEGQKRWKQFSGGGISEIEIFENFALFSSNDNYVYAIDIDTGKKKWKRKLAGRILGSASLDDRFSVYTTTGSTTALVLDKKDGRIAGKYEFKSPFNGSPVAIPGGFAVATRDGVEAFSKHDCKNQKRPLNAERPS